jgi:hypothetical protein
VKGIDIFQPVCVSRILELGARMRVLRFFARIPVTVDTCFLQHLRTTERVGMTGNTGQLQLVMAASEFTGHKHTLVRVIPQHHTRQP